MHHYKILLTICCFLVLFNCKEAQKTTFSEIHFTSENNALVDINIPQVSGNKTVSNQLNTEIQKIIISALHNGSPDDNSASSVEESIAIFNNEFTQFKKDFPESIEPWEAQIDGEVMYQSPEIISIAITSYTNTGGAHGVLNISFLNFKTVTGKLIKNDELIKNIDGFKNSAKPYLNNALAEKDILFDTENFELPPYIAYSEEGIVLLFNIFQIAPYSTEIIEFVIPFEDAQPYLVFDGAF